MIETAKREQSEIFLFRRDQNWAIVQDTAKLLPLYQKEGYTCASRAIPELARHGVTHTIVKVSEHQSIACPMKFPVELNSEIHIFLRKN